MLKLFIKCLIRIRFFLTSKEKASEQIRRVFEEYQLLGNEIDAWAGRTPFRVPEMRGVDEDMRDWSFFMILEHNAIVNGVMKAIVESLSRNEIPINLPVKDIKKGVMPSANPGSEQMWVFCDSVEKYLAMVQGLGRLRGTVRYRYPIFGMLDAHG